MNRRESSERSCQAGKVRAAEWRIHSSLYLMERAVRRDRSDHRLRITLNAKTSSDAISDDKKLELS